MMHDAYKANLFRSRVLNRLNSGDYAGALTAADEAIAYAAASLPRDPTADNESVDAQALFDWAMGLKERGVALRHLEEFERSVRDLDTAERVMQRILLQFPMHENWSALAHIFHARCSSRLKMNDFHAAGRDATFAIQIRRRLAEKDLDENNLLAGTLKTRATAFLLLQNLPLAVQDATEAVAIRRRALPPHPDPKERQVFAMTLYSLAQVLAATDTQAACAAIKEAIEILDSLAQRSRTAVLEGDVAMCRALERDVCGVGLTRGA